ncbi:hypothetical protein TrRE_jg5236 [Triparma retinervis]|uniref:Uncharacterized protein n=1 Tax=Triparma retinervis TaxID=2557542 RepID=A0A9W7E5D8_9STRA|nr:hypothetical protein TrRE_jg5236 [Triparma retinervis]
MDKRKTEKGGRPPLRAVGKTKVVKKVVGGDSKSVEIKKSVAGGLGSREGGANVKQAGANLYALEKKIRRSNREVDWNTKEGHTRTKIKFLNAIKEENHEEALNLVYVLLDYDPMNEMFQQYMENLEGLVKNLADAGSDEGEEEEEDSSDSSDDGSDGDSSSGEEEAVERSESRNYANEDDQAEKKDDDGALARRYGVDTGAKHTDDIDPDFMVDEMNPTAGMTPEQVAKFDELRAQFSSLSASVADKNESDSKLWTAPAENLDPEEDKGGSEGSSFFP